MTKSAHSGHFPLIDPLRGFAAVSVVIYHVIEMTGWKRFPDAFGLVWFKWGWMGTDIFFVISGFVITNSALTLLERHDYATALKIYAGRRIRRIVPLHYLSLLFFIICFAEIIREPNFWQNLVSHLFFVHNFFPEFHRGINAPNWTLGIEMQFYLALIFLIPYINQKNIIYFIGGAFIIAFSWRAFAWLLHNGTSPYDLDRIFITATQLLGMLDFFALGMAIAFFVRSDCHARLRNSRPAKIALLLLILLWGLLSFNVFFNAEKFYWTIPWTVIFPRSMLAILFSLLILILSLLHLPAKLARLLAPLVYLGTISYGIYLLHWPLLMLIRDFDIAYHWKLLLVLGGAIALASLSWHFFERRFLGR